MENLEAFVFKSTPNDSTTGRRIARLSINYRTLVSSVPNINFDSVLTCVDTVLPIGWQRIHVDYAGVPEQTVRSVPALPCLPVADEAVKIANHCLQPYFWNA